MTSRLDPLLVALGGMVGATLRYAIGVAIAGPPGTLAVNVLGSFLLGVFVTRLRDPRAQLLLGTGALSSFTTYSTFAVETAALGTTLGAANVAATYLLGVLAAGLGLVVGEVGR
jgi:CrcB protein